MKITRKAEKLIMLTRGKVDRAMTLIRKNKKITRDPNKN